VIKETDLTLACGALLPGRVLAVAEGSGLAPFGADGLDWFAGMTATGAAEIRAAVEGREALERYLASHEFDMERLHRRRTGRRPPVGLRARAGDGPDDGHVSVLGSCAVAALDWLVARA
jgi:hypothetical protein